MFILSPLGAVLLASGVVATSAPIDAIRDRIAPLLARPHDELLALGRHTVVYPSADQYGYWVEGLPGAVVIDWSGPLSTEAVARSRPALADVLLMHPPPSSDSHLQLPAQRRFGYASAQLVQPGEVSFPAHVPREPGTGFVVVLLNSTCAMETVAPIESCVWAVSPDQFEVKPYGTRLAYYRGCSNSGKRRDGSVGFDVWVAFGLTAVLGLVLSMGVALGWAVGWGRWAKKDGLLEEEWEGNGYGTVTERR